MAKQKPKGKNKNPNIKQTNQLENIAKAKEIKVDDTPKNKSQDDANIKEDNSKYIEKAKPDEDNFEQKPDDKIKIQGKLEKIVPVDTDSTSEVLRKVLTIMSGVIILVCLVVLIASTVKKDDVKSNKDSNVNPVASFSGDVKTDEIDYPEKIQEKFKKLYVANKEIIGIISMDKLNIENPIVQGKDNKYYLNHNFYKAKSSEGTAFLDTNSKPDLSTQNTIIYANNNLEESFSFSQILKLKDVEVYKENPVFSFDTLYDNYRWKIYAVYLTAVDKEDDKNFFDYTNQDQLANDFEGYVKQIDERKLYTTGVDIKPTDKLLSISVACYDFDVNDKKINTRFVVCARLLRDDESEEIDFSKTKINSNPYKPQAFYDNSGKRNPNK